MRNSVKRDFYFFTNIVIKSQVLNNLPFINKEKFQIIMTESETSLSINIDSLLIGEHGAKAP